VIKITIERISIEKYTEIKNFIVKSTPTDKVERRSGSYDSGEKVMCAEEYATKTVDMERKVTTNLLSQEIVKEETFDLTRVIAAINGMQMVP
jgi:hypothetical protein